MKPRSNARVRLERSCQARHASSPRSSPTRALYRHIGGEPLDEAGLRARFTRLETRRSPDGSYSWLNWIVRLCDTDQAVGYVQATVDSSSAATIAYVIGTAWQGRGLASEAVRAMVGELRAAGVREVNATIPASRRSAEWRASGHEKAPLSGALPMRSRGLEPPRAMKPARPSTLYTTVRYVRRRPKRPDRPVLRTPRTHRTM
jgi:Acetyltransferase (GNAT) domain